MKELVINQREVVENMIKYSIKEGFDMMTSFCKAALIETLKKRMMAGETVRFAYLKKDNTIRFAVGTLEPNACKANINGLGRAKKEYGQFAYIDCQKLAWRSCVADRIIGIID